jgi:hypothetical protein
MVRTFAIAASALALLVGSPVALAEPPADDGTTFAIGKCYDPAQPPEQRPASLTYNCDGTAVMTDMTWTSWGPDGARGTGTDVAVECQPNCAQGPTLRNPIVVHAWNPVTAPNAECPRDVRFYTDMTIAYPHGAPPWIQPGTTWSPGTDFVTVDGMPAVHYSDLIPTCLPL